MVAIIAMIVIVKAAIVMDVTAMVVTWAVAIVMAVTWVVVIAMAVIWMVAIVADAPYFDIKFN